MSLRMAVLAPDAEDSLEAAPATRLRGARHEQLIDFAVPARFLELRFPNHVAFTPRRFLGKRSNTNRGIEPLA